VRRRQFQQVQISSVSARPIVHQSAQLHQPPDDPGAAHSE